LQAEKNMPKQDTAKQDTAKQDTAKQDTAKQDTTWASLKKNCRKQPVSQSMTILAVVVFISAVVLAKFSTSQSLALISFSLLVGAAIFRFAFEGGESERDRSKPEEQATIRDQVPSDDQL